MAEIGAPQTTKFAIGTAEVRIGPMELANKLTQAHSLGVLDNVQVQITQESSELQAGFPKREIDSAITSESSQIVATFREYSRRNMNIALGHGLASSNGRGAVDTVASTAAKAGDKTLTVSTPTQGSFKAGDLVVVYGAGRPENVQVLRAKSASAASGTVTLTMGDDTPLIHDVSAGDPVYLAAPVPVGGLQDTKYMAVQVIRLERGSNKPIGWNFWKAAVTGGLDATFGGTEFGSSDMTLKLLQPAVSEYAEGGNLAHLSQIVPSYPVGMRFAPGD